MNFVESVYGKINYQLTNIDYVIKKTANNPFAVEKLLQIIHQGFAVFDLCTGKARNRQITKVMKDTTDFIQFYGSYKNLMYWINPFSKETLDVEKLESSLEKWLKEIKQNQETKLIIKTLIAQEVYSKGEVKKILKNQLLCHVEEETASKIVDNVTIQQKSRPLVEVLSMVCLTVADLGITIMTLKKWEILDLSWIAVSIGSQSRLFMFVVDLGADTVFGVIESAGLVLVVGEATYRTVKNGIKFYQANAEEKKKNYQELRDATLDLLSGSTGLIYTALPLLLTLNPPVIVALAIVAKGTGLICVLVR